MEKIINETALIYYPPNKYWKNISFNLLNKEPSSNRIDLFNNNKEHLWKLKHFQMYEDLFSILKYYDELWFLGPLIRPEIFFSELEYFYFKEDITVFYPSMNKREILNDYIKNFVKSNSIIPVPYKEFVKFMYARKNLFGGQNANSQTGN